jgi:hypothetical protein
LLPCRLQFFGMMQRGNKQDAHNDLAFM